jgi:hypothetical protein
MNEKRQLLCTFSTLKAYKGLVEEIGKFYVIYSDRFFVFTNKTNPDEVFVTYNIISESRNLPKFKNTISIHRKKQTNTLYTLNAMNQIIKDENGGVFDKSFSVNWELYQNSLIITGEPSIRIIPIRMLEIITN